MKRLFYTSVILFLAASAYAIIDLAYTASLTTSYQKVSISKEHSGACVPVAVWTSDNTAFYLAQDASGTGERFIPADTSWGNNCVKVDTDGGIFWVKAESGTPTLYIDVGRASK